MPETFDEDDKIINSELADLKKLTSYLYEDGNEINSKKWILFIYIYIFFIWYCWRRLKLLFYMLFFLKKKKVNLNINLGKKKINLLI